MGMFTSIIDVQDRELQIKCGHDDCETYRVGEVVAWQIWPDQPGEGKLLDGIYTGFAEYGSHDFVIIKDHKIAAVELRDLDHPDLQFEVLKAKYGIVPFERSWWTKKAWLRHDIEQERRRIESLREDIKQAREKHRFLQSLVKVPEKKLAGRIQKWHEEQFHKAVASGIIDKMHEPSWARQIFKVKPLRKRKAA